MATFDTGIASLQRGIRGEGLIWLGLLRMLGIEYSLHIVSGYLAANTDKEIRFTFRTGVTQQLLDGLLNKQ